MYIESAQLTTRGGAFHGEMACRQRWPGPAAAAEPRQTIPTRWLLGALDEIDYGVLLLDAARTVLHANRSARGSLLRGACGLAVTRGVLTAHLVADTQALDSAVRAAASKDRRQLLFLGAPEGRTAVAVMPMRSAGEVRGGSDDDGVLIMLSRTQLCEGLSIDGYARGSGLTSAEARVLMQLCKGLQATEIAELQGVALSTVRTQISSIRLKTATTSIGDLMLQMARLPPMPSVLGAGMWLDAAA
jgi:DNA-binding CsgD family transcriptional regulator